MDNIHKYQSRGRSIINDKFVDAFRDGILLVGVEAEFHHTDVQVIIFIILHVAVVKKEYTEGDFEEDSSIGEQNDEF